MAFTLIDPDVWRSVGQNEMNHQSSSKETLETAQETTTRWLEHADGFKEFTAFLPISTNPL